MPLNVTLIQGGGIGHDLVAAVKHVLAAAGVAVEWDEHVAGAEAIARGKPPLPPEMLDSVRKNGLALKTYLLAAPNAPHTNFNVLLRRALNLYASVRPLKNLKGLPARFQNVD